ncbi:DNA-binding GntR family transcriptional regulator [Actinoalloteichus hoggarensis]|uniref:DNA-binding transcriptional repressor LldR n=1 Tax=Actinoalloteichus hoggarensis TaxID=1470176 RepID=A0A221W1E1_9PSEU|nr:GntR family transcriptional regulator [Actinoalloteichus hoggarensis]ASO19560.1 DNA-binding transcriptional repressor LldR [Actinoalloteichus hoggarensis]MBB5919733.1 DNA-binding GntR family transcriptional regulator [Actinoalloteichus hoggarensis]
MAVETAEAGREPATAAVPTTAGSGTTATATAAKAAAAIDEAAPPAGTTATATTAGATPTTTRRRRRNVLVDEVYESIKNLIMDHVLEPGARVSIDGLARTLAVSPTPVREALARLESAELVVKEPLRGYRTTPLLTLDQLDDLYRFRLLVEPWAAAEAARSAGAAAKERLRAEMDVCATPESPRYRELASHDTRFHLLVAELAGSAQIRRAFERTHCHLHVFRLYYDQQAGTMTLAEHREVTEAISRGEPIAAEAAMRAHLEAAYHDRLRPLVASRDTR